jgi:hypothetical protein
MKTEQQPIPEPNKPIMSSTTAPIDVSVPGLLHLDGGRSLEARENDNIKKHPARREVLRILEDGWMRGRLLHAGQISWKWIDSNPSASHSPDNQMQS